MRKGVGMGVTPIFLATTVYIYIYIYIGGGKEYKIHVYPS